MRPLFSRDGWRFAKRNTSLSLTPEKPVGNVTSSSERSNDWFLSMNRKKSWAVLVVDDAKILYHLKQKGHFGGETVPRNWDTISVNLGKGFLKKDVSGMLDIDAADVGGWPF